MLQRQRLLRLHCQLLQMVCEDLQTDVIRHDDFCRHAALAVVCGGRIELSQQKASLAAILITIDKVGNGESLPND